MRGERARWDKAQVRALRDALGVTQSTLAADLGVRQQTVSDWETGLYEPRGASVRLLDIVAERAGVHYEISDHGADVRGLADSDQEPS